MKGVVNVFVAGVGLVCGQVPCWHTIRSTLNTTEARLW